MKIAVIGTGYVGLVSGACFAQAGYQVTCVDADRAKVASLAKGRVPIYEPGLTEVITEARRKRTLFFSSDTKAAASTADIISSRLELRQGSSTGTPTCLTSIWSSQL